LRRLTVAVSAAPTLLVAASFHAGSRRRCMSPANLAKGHAARITLVQARRRCGRRLACWVKQPP
jgi:hypothetical protein